MRVYFFNLLKNHINTIKTEFQANIKKRNEVFNFFKKKRYICRIFCSTIGQNLEMAISWYRKLRAGTGRKAEKNPLFLQ